MRYSRIAAFSLIIVGGSACITRYVQREMGGRAEETAQARIKGVDASTGVYVIRRDNAPMGISKLAFTTHGDTVEVLEDANLWVPVPGGATQRARQVARTFLDNKLQVLNFEILIEAGGGDRPLQRSKISGVRAGKDSMAITVATGGAEQRVRIRVPQNMAIGQSIWPRVAISGALLVGSSFRASELDPLSLSVRRQEIKVVAVDSAERSSFADFDPMDPRVGFMKVYTVEQKANGLRYALRIREDGLPMRTDLPAGLTVELATPEEVGRLMAQMNSGRFSRELAGGRGKETLIQASAIRAGVPLLGTSLIGKIRVEIEGLPEESDVDGGVQKREGNIVEVTQGSLKIGSQINLPDSSSILPEPFIESNEPAIRQAAALAIRGARKRDEQVRRVNHWVWLNLGKEYTGSLPSALQTLKAREGDCNEHTILAVAMLRSLGIHARVITGLAHVQGSWFYHAWVEVNIGNGWQPVDPTFNEIPAMAGRVRLFVGRDNMFRILPMLGRVKMKVLSATSAEGNRTNTTTDPAGRR